MRRTLWLAPVFAFSLLSCGYNPKKSNAVEAGAGDLAASAAGGSTDAQPGPTDSPSTQDTPGADAALDRPTVSLDSGRADTGSVGSGGSGGAKGSGPDGGDPRDGADALAGGTVATGGQATTAVGGTTVTGGKTGTGGSGGTGGLTGTADTGGVISAGGTTTASSAGGSTVVTECPPDPASLVGTCTANGSKGVNWTIAPKQNLSLTSEELVDDRGTGLTWQRKVASRTSPTCTGPVRLTWDQAMCYCSALSLPGATDGWRLPSRSELMSIVLLESGSPAIDVQAFPGTASTGFWTSSQRADGDGAWEVHFAAGGMSINGDKTTMNLVRCVRGGWETPSVRYALGTGALAGTVLDNGTHLRWQVKPVGPKIADDLAQDCASSTLGQRTWRLPTLMELVSLVDETRSDPAFDKTVFEGTSDEYVSSSQANGVLGVSFWWGQTTRLGSAMKAYGRCVSRD